MAGDSLTYCDPLVFIIRIWNYFHYASEIISFTSSAFGMGNNKFFIFPAAELEQRLIRLIRRHDAELFSLKLNSTLALLEWGQQSNTENPLTATIPSRSLAVDFVTDNLL